MDINKFIAETPYLYHLTSIGNAGEIIKGKKILSAKSIIQLSNDPLTLNILRTKRVSHTSIVADGKTYSLRDQRPISEIALSKCLTDNWTCEDYFEYLNKRVFFWPNLDRLERHFKRYQEEKPTILRLETSSLIARNPYVRFSRLNSGATRANSYLGGIAPLRGPNTFMTARNYGLSIRTIAEVTFENECVLEGKLSISKNPKGPWRTKSFTNR